MNAGGPRVKAAQRKTAAATASRRRIEPPKIFVYVDAVARFGSIRKAAAALHVVSSALNRRVLDLEEELGSPLFERLPRGVRPTAVGEVYLDYVRRCLRDLDVVGTQIDSLRGLLKGRVRVAVAESVTGRMLPMAITRFQAQHANVCFHVWIDGPRRLAESLAADEADLVLTHDLVDRANVSVIAERRHPFCAVVAKEHPLASRKSLRLHDCLAFPVVLPDQSLAVRALIDRALARAAFTFEPAMVSNSVEFTKVFARANNGVSFQFRVGKEPDLTGMVEIPVSDPEFAQARLFLATRRDRVLPVSAAIFVQQLSDSFEDI